MRARGVEVAILVACVLAAAPALAQDSSDTQVPVPQDDEYADTDPSALSDFRPDLDPYGSWQDDPAYGTVWTPDAAEVGAGFEPYDTGGGWDYDDGSPVWVSDFAWGWVCFHYGRWAWTGGRWVWIPGREYAGAWVTWSMGDDSFGYVGWAPMPPSWGWWGGSATALGFASSEPWLFTTYGQFVGPNVGARAVPGTRAGAIAGHSRAYTRARPHVAASPEPLGPPPAALGIDLASVPPAHLPARELRARQLSRPSSAKALGVHAPTPHVFVATPRARGAWRPAGGGAHPVPARGRR